MTAFMNLRNRVVIITGAGTGLGRAVALACATEGSKVALCGRRSGPVHDLAGQVREAGGLAYVHPADVSQPDAMESLVNSTLNHFGDLHVVVNNAAILEHGTVWDTSVELWRRMMAVNVNGPFYLMRAALRHMQRMRFGRIVNISSEEAEGDWHGVTAYATSKAALEGLTRAAAADIGSRADVLINALRPGSLSSEMNPHEHRPAEASAPAVLRLAALPPGGPTGQVFSVEAVMAL